MKSLRFLLQLWLIVIACTLSAQTAIGQSILNNISPNLNISQMSDQQMLQLWQEAQSNGLSETQALKLMSQKGMSTSEINAFKKRLIDIQNTSKLNKNSSGLNLVTDTTAFMRDSSWISEIPQPRKKSKIYGMDFFANPNQSFEPNLRIATPKNYVIGPDDVLLINITGFNENSFNKTVTPEGTVQIPYAGIIHVAGLTIEQADRVIKNKLQQKVYPALKSGQTQLTVTLGSVKTIGVTIIGEAQRPGKYSVSSLASFFNVMYLSGGPTENGSLRNIEVIRNNKVIATVDLYSFLQKGILDNDVKLEDQDVIRIPVYTKHVYLSGEIKRPAVYELQSKETLAELIKLGGGFGDTAYKNNVKVFQLTDKEKKIKDVMAEDFSYYIPHNGDSIFIDKMVDIMMNKVSIVGAVNHPGMYEFSNGLTLAQLVTKADSLRERAATTRVIIKRLDNENKRILISADLNSILMHQSNDIELMQEDSVYIPFISDIQDVENISVTGFVRNPCSLVFRKGMTAADAIVMAGGFDADAATHRVEISRTNKNKSDTLANKLVDIIRIDLDSSNANNNMNFLLQPLDNVFVPRLLNYHSLGSAGIKGEVLFPGEYQIERRDETVKDLIQRAGGLTNFGALANVQVYRKGLRVGVDFLQANGKNDFLLQANDSIYIPKTQSYVEVTGGVFNPQIVAYESSKFSSYISAAGGINEKGRLGKAYIQYSNGINRKTKHFLFFRHFPKVLPGSKIIVPESEVSRNILMNNMAGVTTVLTILTALVTIVKLL